MEPVTRTWKRSHFVKALAALPIGALGMIPAVAEARGGLCERPRRRKSRLPRCGGGLKVCGGTCVPDGATCCGAAAYTGTCPNGRTFRCNGGVAQCCNGGGSKCQPAATAC